MLASYGKESASHAIQTMVGEETMDGTELQQKLAACIDEQLHPGRDRGDRIQACLDLQQVLLGTSLWLESCRLKIDLECVDEPMFEEHLQGMQNAIQSIRLVRA